LKTKVIKAPTAPHIEEVKSKSSDDDVDLIKNLKNDNFTIECLGLTNGKMKQIVNECEKTFFAKERIIWGTSDGRASTSFLCESTEYVFSHRSSYNIFLNECLICRIAFVNRMALIHALAKVSIELPNSDLFSLFRNFRQIGVAFCKPEFIIIKSNYFQKPQKGDCFLDDFEALVREIDVRALRCGREMIF
jgi:hypothetical protein